LQRRFGDSNGDNEEPQRIRIMTREERRKAVEALLGSSAKALDIESGGAADQNVCKSAHGRTKDEKASKASSLDKSLCSDEEHVCSICLTDYHPNDLVFRSKFLPSYVSPRMLILLAGEEKQHSKLEKLAKRHDSMIELRLIFFS